VVKSKYPIYEDIIISPEHLNNLPENDIPHEISSLAKHSVDTSLLAEEQDDYVPDVNVDEEGISVKILL
jgi:hypothetical protein